jgi:hypothetical protein
MAVEASHTRGEIAQIVESLRDRVGANGFALISSWSLEQRRQMLTELESLRRLAFLLRELDEFLARVPGSRPEAFAALVLREA